MTDVAVDGRGEAAAKGRPGGPVVPPPVYANYLYGQFTRQRSELAKDAPYPKFRLLQGRRYENVSFSWFVEDTEDQPSRVARQIVGLTDGVTVRVRARWTIEGGRTGGWQKITAQDVQVLPGPLA